MGIGSSRSRLKMISCQARSMNKEKQIDPHFEFEHRLEGGTYGPYEFPKEGKMTNRDNQVSGYLYRFEHREYEYERKKHKVIECNLVEDGVIYKLKFDLATSIGRAFVNRVITLTGKEEMLFVRLYKQKGKEGDPKEYANIWCGTSEDKLDGIKGKYDNEAQKPYVDYVDDHERPGEKIRVNRRLNEFLFGEYERAIAKLNLIYKDSEVVKKQLGGAAVSPQEVEAAAEGTLQDEYNKQPEPSMAGGSSAPAGESASDDLPF
jgi:hypothetical protein